MWDLREWEEPTDAELQEDAWQDVPEGRATWLAGCRVLENFCIESNANYSTDASQDSHVEWKGAAADARLVVYGAAATEEEVVKIFDHPSNMHTLRIFKRAEAPPAGRRWYAHPVLFTLESCLANLYHFMTDTVAPLYRLLHDNGRLAPGSQVGRRVTQLMFLADPEQLLDAFPTIGACYDHRRYRDLLYALPVRRQYASIAGRH